jgi:hypothetical protein
MHDAGRQAAHVLLDTVSAVDKDADYMSNATAIQLAFQRMQDVGAITATVKDEAGGDLRLDVSPLVGASLISMNWLINVAARHAEREPADIVVGLREYLDSDNH